MSSSSPAGTATATAYWCYSCSHFVRVWPGDPISCPDCSDGFLEEIGNAPPFAAALRQPFRLDRGRRPPLGNRSPFNPVIVFRRPSSEVALLSESSGFELYYHDGAGSGLRPLPQSISDFLMGSGFDRLLDQLTQIESGTLTGSRSYGNTPTSKAAIESLPTVMISPSHIEMDSFCAVCKEAFEVGTEAWEIPCKHIFHQDCIVPWLSLKNSCPVCRHELPTDAGMRGDAAGQVLMGSEEDSVGLTIWRLPGGGFAVGRFSGGRRAGERELPVVYTEMDGSFGSSGAPRRMSWSSRGSHSRQRIGIGRLLRNFFSIFGCFGSSSSSSVSPSRLRFSSGSELSRRSWRDATARISRRLHGLPFEDGNSTEMARW